MTTSFLSMRTTVPVLSMSRETRAVFVTVKPSSVQYRMSPAWVSQDGVGPQASLFARGVRTCIFDVAQLSAARPMGKSTVLMPPGTATPATSAPYDVMYSLLAATRPGAKEARMA